MAPTATQSTSSVHKPSAARERLVATARRLFYAHGITSTGVDRVIREAQVTRATFYRHFPGKEDLVVAYLQLLDDEQRGKLEAVASHASTPREVLAAVVEAQATALAGKGYRGSAFTNAAAEFPNPRSAPRRVIEEHRAWFRALVQEQLTAGGHPDPAFATDLFIQLSDGAEVGAALEDGETARAAFIRAAQSVIAI